MFASEKGLSRVSRQQRRRWRPPPRESSLRGNPGGLRLALVMHLLLAIGHCLPHQRRQHQGGAHVLQRYVCGSRGGGWEWGSRGWTQAQSQPAGRQASGSG